MDVDIKQMSNAEIKLYLKKMEDEYEALKVQVKNKIERMEALDKEYKKVKDAFDKRTRGRVIS